MEFQEVVRRRRMVRTYSDEPVAPAVLGRILHNAVRAPSAGFSQGWAFLVLDRAEDVARFWTATTEPGTDEDTWLRGMRQAPVIVVPLSCKRIYLERYAEADKGWTDLDEARWPAPYWDIDTGMATLLMLQTAVDAGLGACFFGIPPERIGPFQNAFGVPADHRPIGAVSIGHPAESERIAGSAATRPRLVDEVIHRSAW